VEQGYPDEYLELLKRYYDNSVLFVVRHKGTLVGTLRLIDPGCPCRITDFWNIEFPGDVKLSEMSVDKQHRGKSKLPVTALLEVAYNHSLNNGIKWWFANALETDYHKFKKMNPSCRLLNQLDTTEDHQRFRGKYPAYYKLAKSSLFFVFSLNRVSYSHEFKRILRKKFRLNTNAK
jgi:hypothetical protein